MVLKLEMEIGWFFIISQKVTIINAKYQIRKSAISRKN